MLLKGNTVLENIDEGNLTRELEIAKFQNYGRENFSDLIQYKITLNDYIRNSSKFYSIELPKEISDYFIRADISTYFIMSEAPILRRIEEFLLVKNNKHDYVSNYREIKNYYYKWLIQKTPKEKHFFAKSIVNSVERNFAFQSFFNVMVYGIILSNDTVSYNSKRAIELFNRAIEIVEDCSISSTIKDEILYVINIYKGFTYLKEYEYLRSLETFREALNYNSNGVTAFFYCALSSRYIDDFDLSYDYLRKVIEFDKIRFKYAIKFNQLALFTFFFENLVFYNVFTENGFAQLLPDIDFIIKSLNSGDANSMEITYSKLINLDNLRIKEFFDDTVLMEIQFLKNALDQYKLKRTGLIRIVEQIFRDKLLSLIKYIKDLIEAYYYDQIKKEINVYDKQIEQNKRQLTRIKHEMEDSNKKVNKNLEEATEYLEETITERSKFLEEKIKNFDKDPKHNPSQIFYSSIVFTVFVSFVILLIVGVITSIVGFGEEVASTNVALRTGIKWGGLTFVVGVFFSVFSAFSSFWGKASDKKELVNKLNKVKELEAEERELMLEDSERKTLVYGQKFKERIMAQEKIVNDFEIERDQNYKHKYKLAKKEIDDYITPLNNLLKSIENVG